uniref:Putative exodeoxyribonuclease 8 PDDEXK-like domain-containing protein n=1 Tax=mine drainage metagenome TaxID=410659 RepID=E6QW59_9ZZZZ
MQRIVRNLPNAEYHSGEEISHSGIVQLLKSPEHYLHYKTGDREPTPAMEFGSAFHTYVLEPALFHEVYSVVDEAVLAGTLATLDDYKAAATQLCVKFEALNKDELKAAIKAADKNGIIIFKDEMQQKLAALTNEKLAGALATLDDLKQAATSLGIEIGKMKKDELKAAIKAADTEAKFTFREDVQAEMAALTADKLAGTLATLDDYKAAATQLCVKFEALNKDELKAAIKVADVEFKFKFREDEFDRLYGDKIVLKQEQMESLAAMRASIFKHAGAAGMLVTGEAETSLFWTDEYTGLPCRIRPDWMFGAGIADLKSCITASKDAFAKTVANMGYDVQAAFYVDGMKAVTGRSVNFHFIAVEKTAPFSTACYTASQEMIEVGRAKYRGALELLKWCQDNQKFPGYQPSGEIETIDLPRWAANFDLEA